MLRRFTADVRQEGESYIAQCREAEMASQGGSAAAAMENLAHSLLLYFAAPLATGAPDAAQLELEMRVT